MAKKIYLSPSSQPENAYAYGNTNEQTQCRRIADACEVALKRCGFEVKNGNSGTMYTRAAESDVWGADLHVPIHTNASANGNVTGTRIFCFNTTGEGYKAANAVFNVLAPLTPGTSESVTADASLYEVNVPSAPTVYVEAEFHDVPTTAKWIIENVETIGEAIAKGICNHYGVKYVERVVEKGVTVNLAVLKSGSKGDDVKALQALLKGYGYNLGIWGVDGDFGAATDKAVKQYQKKKGLVVDGIVGANTWKSLLGA